MSKRSRFFEFLAYRDIMVELWKHDRKMKWCVAPKPSMSDQMYDNSFWTISEEERLQRMRSYNFVAKNDEPIFDAADITRVGKDIFIQESMTTNKAGIEWLQRDLQDNVRVHPLHFPDDPYPTHIDASFIPLRPPTTGSSGLVLINPDRPPVVSEVQMWLDNDWELLVAPQPAFDEVPIYSPCSKWLSMNLLSIGPKTLILEENEVPLHNLLNEYGFEIITVPFRHVFEFGGAIHCATWDIRRNDQCVDYFPDTSSFNIPLCNKPINIHNPSHLRRT
jgi:glycine amidinotransferase